MLAANHRRDVIITSEGGVEGYKYNMSRYCKITRVTPTGRRCARRTRRRTQLQ